MTAVPFVVGPEWAIHKRSLLETQPLDGREVTCVVGWEVERSCGCQLRLGMRLDRREATFGLGPCDEHGAQVRRVLDSLQHMPPSEEAIVTLAARLLDAELEPWKASV